MALPSADVALTPGGTSISRSAQDSRRASREGVSDRRLLPVDEQGAAGPIWRRITPHAFGYVVSAGTRGPIATLDTSSRISCCRASSTSVEGRARRSRRGDWLWNNYFDVIIGPHPGLTASQKKVVAKDYGLDQGNGVLSVRYAMLFYVLKRLGLLGDAAKQSAHTHIVTINRKETEAALEKAELQL